MPVLIKKANIEFDRQATGNDGHPYWISKCKRYRMIRWRSNNWRIYNFNGDRCTEIPGYSSRAEAEQAIQKPIKMPERIVFADKAMESQCGRYKLDYKKTTGWRTYKRPLGDSTSWVVMSIGYTYASRAEAIECVNSYHKALTEG